MEFLNLMRRKAKCLLFAGCQFFNVKLQRIAMLTTSYFTFALTLALAAQAFNLDILPRRSKTFMFENRLTENAFNKGVNHRIYLGKSLNYSPSPDFKLDTFGGIFGEMGRVKQNEETPIKALSGLLTESTLHVRSTILKALRMNVEEQIMKELEAIPAAIPPRAPRRSRNKHLGRKMAWNVRLM